MTSETAPLVLGVGTRHRRDDAVGLEVVDRVRERMGARVRAAAHEGEGTALLERWAGEPLVVVVDALAPRGQPGRIVRVEGDLGRRLADPPPTSTHGVSVGEAWRLGASLGLLPQRLVVFGVEGVDFRPGDGLTPQVAAAIGPVTDAIVSELTRQAGSEVVHA